MGQDPTLPLLYLRWPIGQQKPHYILAFLTKLLIAYNADTGICMHNTDSASGIRDGEYSQTRRSAVLALSLVLMLHAGRTKSTSRDKEDRGRGIAALSSRRHSASSSQCN